MNAMITKADIAIIGAGMAGASLAAEIGDSARVVLIEGEAQPGYHSTGRSAAFWQESYGGPAVQPLTSASRAYLDDHGFLGARGAIHLAAGAGGMAALARLKDEFAAAVQLDPISPEALERRIPGLRSGFSGGLAEPSCRDIDVAGLHAHYLARARRSGATLLCDARARTIEHDGDWRIRTDAGDVRATILVDAAGAWADDVAALAGVRPIGITPLRRTMVQLRVDPAAAADLPLVLDAESRFYFKPEAGGRIWVTPHDETPTVACDAAPEEIDIARAIDRFERTVDWKVVGRERAWAGLRSFSPDRAPVYGFDPGLPGFFWFAAQGGFGIQTAPAAAMMATALLLGGSMPAPVAAIDAERYGRRRFG